MGGVPPGLLGVKDCVNDKAALDGLREGDALPADPPPPPTEGTIPFAISCACRTSFARRYLIQHQPHDTQTHVHVDQ